MKRFLVPILKLTVAVALLWWLVAEGKLDFKQLGVFYSDPAAFALNFFVWLICYVLLGAWRWHILLRGLQLEVTYRRAVVLQLIGFFFNTAMPGAVGGDIVKAFYVVREQQTDRKTPAMVTVVLDRVTGLVGLFALAGVGSIANHHLTQSNDALRAMENFVFIGLGAIVVGSIIVFFPFAPGRDPFLRLFDRRIPGFVHVKRVYEATRSYRDQPLRLIFAVLLTCVLQSGSMLFAIFVTQRLTGFRPDLATFATIYPIGLLATALPLAPGGMGVGHMAFKHLYMLVGWSGGADVFNVMVLGSLVLNLIGVAPYLFYRSKLAPTPNEVGGPDSTAKPSVRPSATR